MIKLLKILLGRLFKKYNELFFVGSTDILPEPLSKEEEEKYVDMFQNGDLKARDKLIEHNLRLVVYLSKKYENTKVELEDLVSIGTIGLIKGINTYKNDKNIKLATYASRCIDNEILMYLRKNKKRKADVSLDESLSFDSEGNELHLEDILGTEKDIVTKDLEENDMRKIMLKEIGKLNERDKQIMVLRYGLNDTKEYTQKEVAELLGISQSYISRIEKKVISKISSMIKI
ncbi:rNA polymerase sigma factor [Clostridium sp. CAG:433]|jgi:RNA polymerase sigma factor, sigma-70 family|nr:rNA polymerase sigma factor [Clostridium sp. CAG:433]HCJ32141.1 sporulation sigma factor SigE [Bacillota bacterium]